MTAPMPPQGPPNAPPLSGQPVGPPNGATLMAGPADPNAPPPPPPAPPDPALQEAMQCFAPNPTDELPDVATQRFRALRNLLASKDYLTASTPYQQAAQMEYERMRQAAGIMTRQEQAAQAQAQAQQQAAQAQQAAATQHEQKSQQSAQSHAQAMEANAAKQPPMVPQSPGMVA